MPMYHTPSHRPWGAGGVRYDEACEACGKTSTVDNDSGLCRKFAAQSRPLHEIADDIYADWKNIYFGAKPYLEAMSSMDKITDDYGSESGHMIVAYFLSNATKWRGPKAVEIKADK